MAAAQSMKKLSFPLSALALALALAGCTSMAPKYERPLAPVAAEFPAAPSIDGAPATAPVAGPVAADLRWQDYFVEPRLQRLIGLALANNRDLRVAVLNIEAARAQYQIRRADELPTLNAAFQQARQPVAGRQTTTYTAGLAVSAFELDLFGRVRSLSDAALASYFGTEEARKSAQISLIATVASQYLALAADDELIALTRRTLDTRLESLRLTQLKFDNGAASDFDLRQAQSLVEAARVTLAQAARQRALDEDALVLLVGQPLPAELRSTQGWAMASLADLPAGLPSEVLLRRPDVRQAEQTLLSANASIGAARAAFWPRISLTGSFGFASSHLSELFDNTAWTFIPAITLPIFDHGRNRANLGVAQAQRDIAVAQYEKAVQSAFRDVADALASRATLAEQLRAVQAQAAAEQGRFELTDLRFRNGVSNSLELLDAQRSLFSVQQQVVQTQLALLQNKVSVYRALGGGWSEADTAAAAAAGSATPSAAVTAPR